ncbi:hypothetical protein [Lacipirellula limnantheis]|uniref:Uncharacterized protein n=1 Tax=Lacipirellula limnantheis TaxID=2528024 RepID=A0A517U0A4_9BACT|nr:hypothetical protein [Lacipirellula limnantheis]QDT74035.1 hypothetical protein I41_32290 [Lacipirellula limnantheis]
MLTYLRYALASVCFAASVACLALWFRSIGATELLMAPNNATNCDVMIGLEFGRIYFAVDNQPMKVSSEWSHISGRPNEDFDIEQEISKQRNPRIVSAPLIFAALIFALAGVGVLRFRRQFSIRSALICVSVVALLLGMVVAL